jgi:hypothetical protein
MSPTALLGRVCCGEGAGDAGTPLDPRFRDGVRGTGTTTGCPVTNVESSGRGRLGDVSAADFGGGDAAGSGETIPAGITGMPLASRSGTGARLRRRGTIGTLSEYPSQSALCATPSRTNSVVPEWLSSDSDGSTFGAL